MRKGQFSPNPATINPLEAVFPETHPSPKAQQSKVQRLRAGSAPWTEHGAAQGHAPRSQPCFADGTKRCCLTPGERSAGGDGLCTTTPKGCWAFVTKTIKQTTTESSAAGTPAEVHQTARDLGPSWEWHLDTVETGKQWLKKGFWQRQFSWTRLNQPSPDREV